MKTNLVIIKKNREKRSFDQKTGRIRKVKFQESRGSVLSVLDGEKLSLGWTLAFKGSLRKGTSPDKFSNEVANSLALGRALRATLVLTDLAPFRAAALEYVRDTEKYYRTPEWKSCVKTLLENRVPYSVASTMLMEIVNNLQKNSKISSLSIFIG